MPKIGHFGSKSINSLILTKFYLYLFWMFWFQIWYWSSKILSPNPQIWAFWIRRYKLFNLNEILPVRYFEGADFKPDIRFLCFLAVSTQVTRTNSMSLLCKLFGKRFSFCKGLKVSWPQLLFFWGCLLEIWYLSIF